MRCRTIWIWTIDWYGCAITCSWLQEGEASYGIRFARLNADGGIRVNYGDPTAQFVWERFCEGLQ